LGTIMSDPEMQKHVARGAGRFAYGLPDHLAELASMSWTKMTLRRVGLAALIGVPLYRYLQWRDYEPMGIIKSQWAIPPDEATVTSGAGIKYKPVKYWHKQNVAYNTDKEEMRVEMKKSFGVKNKGHVVILGAGIQGLCTAYFVNKLGYRVTIIEKEKTAGLKHSFNLMQPDPSKYESHLEKSDWSSLWQALTNKRQPGVRTDPFRIHEEVIRNKWDILWMLRYFPRCFFQSYFGFNEKGQNLVNYSQKQMELLLEETGIGERLGSEAQCSIHVYEGPGKMVGETITKEEAIKREPILEHLPRIDNLKFTLTPERKVYSPHRFAQFLADYLERNGVRIQYNSKVLFFERDYDRLLSVQTDEGRMVADAFVMTMGAASMEFARQWGTCQYMKKYAYIFSPDSSHPIIENDIHLHPSECTLTSFANTLCINWLSELDHQRNTVRGRRINEFRAFIGKYFPSMDTSESHLWMDGHIVTPDSIPLITRANYPNLFYNFGHGRNSFATCAGSGKMLAELLAGNDCEINQMDYDIRRFWFWHPMKARDRVLDMRAAPAWSKKIPLTNY